jgi:ribosome-associated heat shock protein Hsp15
VSPRLDIWLDVACLFKTRSEAQKACRLGKVSVNGAPAKAHRDVKVGDELIISRPLGRRQTLTVVGLAETHIAKADARQLYQDTTPASTPEEIEMRRIERLYRATTKAVGRPTRDDRRARRKMTGKD